MKRIILTLFCLVASFSSFSQLYHADNVDYHLGTTNKTSFVRSEKCECYIFINNMSVTFYEGGEQVTRMPVSITFSNGFTNYDFQNENSWLHLSISNKLDYYTTYWSDGSTVLYKVFQIKKKFRYGK
jgi:hypothetical protein